MPGNRANDHASDMLTLILTASPFVRPTKLAQTQLQSSSSVQEGGVNDGIEGRPGCRAFIALSATRVLGLPKEPAILVSIFGSRVHDGQDGATAIDANPGFEAGD
jgi:hypothetical protein